MAPKSSVVSTPSGQSHARSGRTLLGRLWYRQLDHYPDNGPRAVYLAIVVLVTITLYYQLYVQFSVSTLIIRDFGMTFTFFVYISVVGNAIGAFASLAAGLADRWGRANLVTYGLLVTAVLVLVGLPNAPNKVTYLVLYAAVSLVEGMLLVATPALIRDFSPQLGRASAMGFWTLGPVIGGLVVTEVSSNTLGSHPHWQTQFYYAGAAGLVLFAVALVGLRELSPSLRDQLMVSLRDRALIEARAAGLDVDAALAHHWRQMLKLDVIGSAFAISVFLLFYYTVVGFFVVYFATTFGFTEAQANSLGNWYWAFNAAALVFSGIVSDLLRVRKPLMIVGAVGSIVVTSVFALQTTHPHTTYHTFALIIALIAVFGGITFSPWMASFTETVEKPNPAATATGLAVWGWVIRAVLAVAFVILPFVVSAATPLIDQGQPLQAIVAAHPDAVATLQALDPATADALRTTPADRVALATALGEVARGSGASPEQATRVQAAARQRFAELATATALDPTTLAAISRTPPDPAAVATAQAELARAFGISPAQALTRLLALAPARDDLALVQPYAAKLQAAYGCT